MVASTDLRLGLNRLGLSDRPVIAHASLRAFGLIDGGAESLSHTLLASSRGVIMPAFTYKTMVTPGVGPRDNGLRYGSDEGLNRMAEPFHPRMPVDPMIGALAETLRRHPSARRTFHPIQSFAGVNTDAVLHTQTIHSPLAPIGALAEQDGWVLLLGVDHTVNTSIHYAEKLAGRRQFVRWAMLKDRIIECPGFPGDSSGFNQIADDLEKAVRRVEIGHALIQAIPLKALIKTVVERIKQDPLALLCQREDCERCNAVRTAA